jgi:hypothetical protein
MIRRALGVLERILALLAWCVICTIGEIRGRIKKRQQVKKGAPLKGERW